MKIYIYKTLFIFICVIPIILLIIALSDYIANDETKVEWVDLIEEIHTEDGDYIEDNSGYYTIHTHSQNLVHLMLFFSWMYPVILYCSAPILFINRKSLLFKSFYYFSILLCVLTWLIALYNEITHGELI